MPLAHPSCLTAHALPLPAWGLPRQVGQGWGALPGRRVEALGQGGAFFPPASLQGWKPPGTC